MTSTWRRRERRLRGWVRWRLGLGPTRSVLLRECDGLQQAIHAAKDRNRLTQEQAEATAANYRRRLEQCGDEVAELREQIERLREAVASAHTPMDRKGCSKIRYLHREDAQDHAAELAIAQRGGPGFLTYQCRTCPQYPVGRTRPWHVATAHPADADAGRDVYWVDGQGELVYPCGCRWHVRGQRHTSTCAEHAEQQVPV